jgi:hypothetical protein
MRAVASQKTAVAVVVTVIMVAVVLPLSAS